MVAAIPDPYRDQVFASEVFERGVGDDGRWLQAVGVPLDRTVDCPGEDARPLDF